MVCPMCLERAEFDDLYIDCYMLKIVKQIQVIAKMNNGIAPNKVKLTSQGYKFILPKIKQLETDDDAVTRMSMMSPVTASPFRDDARSSSVVHKPREKAKVNLTEVKMTRAQKLQ